MNMLTDWPEQQNKTLTTYYDYVIIWYYKRLIQMSTKESILVEFNDPRVVAKALFDQQAQIIEQQKKIIELLSEGNSINKELSDITKSLDWKVWEYFRPESERE